MGGWVSIIWSQIPDQYKAAKTGNEFKMKIKGWNDLSHLYIVFHFILLT